MFRTLRRILPLALVLPALASLAAAAGARRAHPAPASAARRTTAPVTVSPLPGTPDASPVTQISFLGARGTRVLSVAVSGSRSGRHSGRLEAYSTATGESFIPARAFASGERVRVRARVREGGRTTIVGTHFTVAFQAPVPTRLFRSYPGDPAQVRHYLSAPSLTPSTVTIRVPAQPGSTPGDFFLTPQQGAGTPGPMIVDQQGHLVWFHPLGAGVTATDLQPQRLHGRTVLTWWQGRIVWLGFGQGVDEIYSTSYRPLARVRAGNGYMADLHQFQLTAQGTAWIDAYDPVKMNLSAVGGSRRGVLTDSLVQEIDVKTGLVMWEWHALGHLPLAESYAVMEYGSHAWDFAHLNAVDPGPHGQLLVSSRNTWTVSDVDRRTGAVLWQIGGRHPTFRPGPGAVFRFQHDASWQPGGRITVFDNGYSVDGDTQSRGLLLAPDLRTRRVTLIRQFTNPSQRLLAESQGDLLNLHDGDWLMGYGGLPNFTEYDRSGRVLLDASLGTNVESYRTYLAPWRGEPVTPPAIAAQRAADGAVTVEASWNGATDVAAWRVLAGPSPAALASVATAARSGFETTCSIAPAADVAVQALDAAGRVLATSATIAPS